MAEKNSNSFLSLKSKNIKNLVFVLLYFLLCKKFEERYMGENLVIVESPAKAKTIEKFLGEGYVVKSSFGHIRDLSKKNLGIDIEHDFKPDYIISDDKKKVVSELKEASKKADMVWLASDEDREGEAIAWHLQETLKLKADKTKRIVFHEITKDAILNAIKNPRQVDINLVMAQQARRVLDRLVGFELSPILWKKIKPSLSAGRVQSVALRLIVDREREILNFKSTPYFKIEGMFHPEGMKEKIKVKGQIERKISGFQEAMDMMHKCNEGRFRISHIAKKELKRSPAAPFTTSSLQQEAARKCGFSVSQTMSIAQKLYESGFITYMRTDSTNLSSLAINSAKKCITELYGPEYSKTRMYHTKVKGAQEAHEAIRPTYLDHMTIEGSAAEKKLYSLIWKRTIASQMADASLERTDITITNDHLEDPFIAQGTQVLFDGFLKVYIESHDDEQDEDEDTLLPALETGHGMDILEINAFQKYTAHPSRYTEASLVKKMEELGIGRPSTYAPTISTLHNRGYIIKDDRPGESKEVTHITLKDSRISTSVSTETVGSEKGKLCPEDIGILVTDFLADHFKNILDYGFTARIEEGFDKIAEGEMTWLDLIRSFYSPFHETVTSTMDDNTHQNSEKVLGTDPSTGKIVIARMGRFGPLVQLGANEDSEKKFASLKKGQLLETVTLEQALDLLKLPRVLGTYEGAEVSANIGRFGPYIKYNSKFISLGKDLSPYTVDLDTAIRMIKEAEESEQKKSIREFAEEDIHILNGRYGAYIKHGKNNYKIPKGIQADQLDLEGCRKIIAEADASEKPARRGTRSGKK